MLPRGLNLKSGSPTHRWIRGFTLFESLLVLVILGTVGAALVTMSRQTWGMQNEQRDEIIGHELLRACGERLIALRRTSYSSVSTAACQSFVDAPSGGFTTSVFNAPTVTLRNASNATPGNCDTTTCLATISVTKKSGSVSLAPLAIQFINY